jgi:AcrR family transcriptional regulator
MIVSTALLMRERGARATSLDDVLEHSGAPRGSIYHHFPGGREQLLREATDYAGEYVGRRLDRAVAEDPLGALDELFAWYRTNLTDSDFRAGCPVVAVAVESGSDGPDLSDNVKGAFDRWRTAVGTGLAARGVAARRADELALLIVASLEGAIVLSRAYRELGPLDRVRDEIRELVQAELTAVEEAAR